jgi:hypothetical protein
MSTKKSDRLLETDIHQLATSRRFSEPANSTRMTLDAIPDEWLTLFEKSNTQQEWDTILKVTERARPSVFFAAREACTGRDSRSQRIAAHRQQCADFLDSL